MKRALEGLDGVKDAEVSFEKEEAQVTFDPQKVTTAQMIEAVNRMGFGARLP